MSTLAVVSGGMDSVTMLHVLHDQGEKKLGAISFDYGQRHGRKELNCALQNCNALNLEWTLIDMAFMKSLLIGSSLTDSRVDVPEGHYAAESMKATVVPNRNMIMLSIAAGVALANGFDRIATAVHAGDHAIYPDCRPQFIEEMGNLLDTATDGFWEPFFGDGAHLYAPFVNIDKADIVRIGDGHGVDWTKTWSCYVGEEAHCGKCGTCVERKEAFRLAGVVDPTPYKDEAFEVAAYRG